MVSNEDSIEGQLGPPPPLGLSTELLRAIMNLASQFTGNDTEDLKLLREAISQHIGYTEHQRTMLLDELENEDKVMEYVKYARQNPDEMRRLAF
jgi:hypothetical protein